MSKMTKLSLSPVKHAVSILLLIGLAAGLLGTPSSTRAAPAPALLETATLPPTISCTPSCDLYAKAGTLNLPDGVTVPIWGYATSAGGDALLPGPVILAEEGDALSITLHNALPVTTSLSFPALSLVPDMVGVAPDDTKVYTFTADNPGTFLYEADLVTADGARQVAMGLFGALIVRPTLGTNYAYNNPDTRFDDETLLIYSEIDPALNANPLTFNMQTYAPVYFLINGKAYPDTVPIPTSPGAVVLLRHLNAGLNQHSIGLLGLDQEIIAVDAGLFPYASRSVAETVPAGQALDALVTMPGSAVLGSQYPLYDAGWHTHNAGALLAPGGPVAFGGMITFLTIAGTLPSADGPLAVNLQISPNPTRGTSGAILNATVSDVTTGGQNVVAAEYFIDNLGAPGSGTPMSGPFGTPTVAVNAMVPAAVLMGLPTGEHTFYIRGRDAHGTWGAVNSVILLLDRVGPATTQLDVSPNLTNGSGAVTLHATADDTAFGNTNVVAAEYRIDSRPAQPMTLVTTGSPVAELAGTIPAATVASLTEGAHTISVRSQDVVGNWGPWTTAVLKVDKTGPTSSNVTVTPDYLDLSGAPPVTAVRLDATLTDPLVAGVNANVSGVEGFIDTVGPTGSGFPLLPQDGVFDESGENAYYNIPIVNFITLRQGVHTLYVRGRDAAGNWGATAAVTITIWKGINDTVGPIITVGPNITPNPTGGQLLLSLTATAADPDNLSNIAAAEWFRGADPGQGNGTPLQAADGTFNTQTEALRGQLNAAGWGIGLHQISVRAMDELGNWGSVATTTVNVNRVLLFLPLVAR